MNIAGKKSHPSGSVQESSPFNSTHRWASLKVKKQGAWRIQKNDETSFYRPLQLVNFQQTCRTLQVDCFYNLAGHKKNQHLERNIFANAWCPFATCKRMMTCDDKLKLGQAEIKLSNPPALEIRRFQVTPPASLRPLVGGPTRPHWAYQASNSKVATAWRHYRKPILCHLQPKSIDGN